MKGRRQPKTLATNRPEAIADASMAETKPADEDGEFETADAGASLTYPQQCSALRKNGYVMIRGNPCKIMQMDVSKTGKHGHAKIHMVGIDIFTGKKHEDICPSTHNMDVPIVRKSDYLLMGVTADGYTSLLDDEGRQRQDIAIADDDMVKALRDKLRVLQADDDGRDIMVCVIKAVDIETVISWKVSK